MKTLVLDKMPELFWQKVNKAHKSYFTTDKSLFDNIEIIIIRTKTILSAEDINHYPHLKLIIRAGSGYDNIDAKAALRRNIIVCTTPEANVEAAYEHTIGLILALIKQLQKGKDNVLSGNWKNDFQNNWELSDLKALIIGVGRIGSRVSGFLRSAGAEVKGVDPYISNERWKELGIPDTDLTAGLKWCNLISFHCPLYEETRNFFSQHILEKISNKIWLVNTARGGLVDLDTVSNGLNSGIILGYGTDVFRLEPPNLSEFFRSNNVYLSPHVGAFTQKAKIRMVNDTLKVWEKYVFEKKVINKIDERFI